MSGRGNGNEPRVREANWKATGIRVPPDWENRMALDPPGDVISKSLSASSLSEIAQVKSKHSQTVCCVSNEDSSAIRQGAQSVTTAVRP